jgi:hypothetical protein
VAQAIYYVEGTTTAGTLGALEVESFGMNACAMTKGHAAEIVDRAMRERGYRGTVVAKIHTLSHSCGSYGIGDVLRIK